MIFWLVGSRLVDVREGDLHALHADVDTGDLPPASKSAAACLLLQMTITVPWR
jgi:hypothetical protein